MSFKKLGMHFNYLLYFHLFFVYICKSCYTPCMFYSLLFNCCLKNSTYKHENFIRSVTYDKKQMACFGQAKQIFVQLTLVLIGNYLFLNIFCLSVKNEIPLTILKCTFEQVINILMCVIFQASLHYFALQCVCGTVKVIAQTICGF